MKLKYYHARYNPAYGKSGGSYLYLIGEKISISVSENCEGAPYLDIDIGDNLYITAPESDEYSKVKPITAEVFNTYYNQTIRSLNDSFLSDAEHYLGHSLDSYRYYSYTDKSHLILDIYDSIESFHCKMYSSWGIKGRSSTRKYCEPISEVFAKQLFNLTIELLYDCQNIENLKDKYFKQANLLIHEGKPIGGLILNADVDFNEIRLQIEQRIASIENRMIIFDDPKSNRNELRGELKGLKYCLDILDKNR